MISRPATATATVTALVVAASLFLGGCSLLPRVPILNPGGNDGGSSSDDSNNNNIGDDIEENPFLGHDVPEGFPAEIPLPDFDIVFSLKVSDDAWSITYGVNDLESDFTAINDQFTSAGWEVLMSSSASDSALGVYSKDNLQVQVTGSADGGNDYDGPILSFTAVRSN